MRLALTSEPAAALIAGSGLAPRPTRWRAGCWRGADDAVRVRAAPSSATSRDGFAYSETPPRRPRAARRLPLRRAARLLPAVLRRDGAAAAHGRRARAGGGRLHARLARTRKTERVRRARLRRALVGRGLVPAASAGSTFDPTPAAAPPRSQTADSIAPAPALRRRAATSAATASAIRRRRRRPPTRARACRVDRRRARRAARARALGVRALVRRDRRGAGAARRRARRARARAAHRGRPACRPA